MLKKFSVFYMKMICCRNIVGPQMNALKCKEHFARTLVRPVGRSAGLREVNEGK